MKALLAIAHYTADATALAPLLACVVGWRGLAQWGEQDFSGPCRATRAIDLDILVIDDGVHTAAPQLAGLAKQISVAGDPLRLPLMCRQILDDRRDGYDLIGYSEHDNWPTTGTFFAQVLAYAAAHPAEVLIPHRYERIAQPPYKVYIDGPNGHGDYSALWMLTAAQWSHWRDQPHFLTYSEAFAGPLESGGAWSLMQTFRCVKPQPPGALESEHWGQRYAQRSIGRGVTWE